MGGFSPDWLSLREPADRAARNPDVLDACHRAFAGRDRLTICDLGAGTGASVRALSAILPPRQRWILVDDDPAMLAAAQRNLAGVDVVVERRDLAADPTAWPADADLVTASAFFDLVSLDWIARFVAVLKERGKSLLAGLTVDGTIVTEPAQPLDTVVSAAFRKHQERDKGFGPAVGPWAGGLLAHYLRGAGYELTSGESPWLLDAGRLRDEYLDGVVTAVAETGLISAQELSSWRDAAAASKNVRVGHTDLFARSR
jgi:hypothetical protein